MLAGHVAFSLVKFADGLHECCMLLNIELEGASAVVEASWGYFFRSLCLVYDVLQLDVKVIRACMVVLDLVHLACISIRIDIHFDNFGLLQSCTHFTR